MPESAQAGRAPLVEVRGLEKRFIHEGRELTILRPIDLTIDRGEMLSIVGASGAGKSTLLHLLGTLDLPSAGSILFDGQDVTSYSSSQLADIPQSAPRLRVSVPPLVARVQRARERAHAGPDPRHPAPKARAPCA